MNKTFLSILFALVACFGFGASAHAQSYGILSPGCSLTTAQGAAVAGAQVFILTEPANVTNFTPQAQVYSSSTGGAVSQPLSTNGFGACQTSAGTQPYVAPGLYTVCYVSPFTGTQCYPDQPVLLPAGGSGFIVNPISGIQWPIASGTSLPTNLCPTSITGNLTSGSSTVLGVSSFSDLYVGQVVTGSGIPSGTTITAISSSLGSITLSAAATTTQSGAALSNYSIGQPFQDTSTNAEYFCSATGWEQGVQQIVAGTGISVSPNSGIGVVTVSSTIVPGAPNGSLQFDDDGVFGGSNSDWNLTTTGDFTLGGSALTRATSYSCNGTNCTIIAANSFTTGQTIAFGSDPGASGSCLAGSGPVNVLSTGLSTSQFEVTESGTRCSGTLSEPGSTIYVTQAFAGLMVNSGPNGVTMFANDDFGFYDTYSAHLPTSTSPGFVVDLENPTATTDTGEITLRTINSWGETSPGDITLEAISSSTNVSQNYAANINISASAPAAATSNAEGGEVNFTTSTSGLGGGGVDFTLDDASSEGNAGNFVVTTSGASTGSGNVIFGLVNNTSVSDGGLFRVSTSNPIIFPGCYGFCGGTTYGGAIALGSGATPSMPPSVTYPFPNSVILAGPTSMSASYTVVLPAAQGVGALTDNGSGALTWGGALTGTALDQAAASSYGGSCTMSSATSCTLTIATTYTTPVCVVTQESSTLTGGVAGCTVSGTTVTVTAATSNSEAWGVLVFGNPD